MTACLNKTFLIISILAINNSIWAQDSIDVFLNAQMQKRKIPGLQLAIVKEGKIVKTAHYGLASVQDSIAVTDNTLFTINSITKAFIGVAIMQLVEQGILHLSSPISTLLSDLPTAWKAVTIQQLLSHTSGIPDIVDEEEAVLIAATLEDAWNRVLASPMDFKPGEKFSYNQTNYLLLGRIIDTVSEMPFTRFIIEKQLQKVAMPHTIRAGFGAEKDVISGAARSYRYSQGKLANLYFSFPPPLQTAAGMSSTATEIATWIIALQSNMFLNKTSLSSLWTPALLSNGKTGGFSSVLNGYAAGWPVVSRTEHPAVAPVGGGRSAVFVYPDDNLSVIVLTNLSGGSPDMFIDEIAGYYIADMKESNGFGLSASVKFIRSRLEKFGYKNVVEQVKRIKTTNAFNLTEKEVNDWGYRLISQNRLTDGLEIFKLNVYLYPASANAFDSLAETYAELGDNKLSIVNYEQSLKLDRSNDNAFKQIKKLKAVK
ncbi:serine hydrolase domain-containing protein [Segetibacter sp.]|jgi:CubicO group peptidase (beta-lactamase class C family)|uniref:serine hydrolase domain-containing protein n=1 Tax=Segetibacter sp. TaxID=2231182 RepID=UPI00260A9F27|nr:serine hydrolase domain-containing protein [Segetibacter sp.]MCW3080960.1 beta-lactamase [Segetibacter sp.]